MNVKHFVIAASLGLGLSLALLWVLGGAAIPINAAPAPRALSDATPVHYVAITGTDGGDCSTPAGACQTVQYAVDRAGEGDEVRVATGVYTGVHRRPAPSGYLGPAVITQVVYISKTVTVRGGYTTTDWSMFNPISYPTTLDAQEAGRVMFIAGDISPTVEGLRITGGNAGGLDGRPSPVGWINAGGGMYIITAAAVVSDNQVFSNVVNGLYLYNSPSTLTDNIIFGNAGGEGGGLYLCNSPATLSRNTVSSNTASMGGGLILSNSMAVLNGNTIFSNTASWSGGGLILNNSDATLSDNIIYRNIAADNGGGIVVNGSSVLSGNVIFANAAGDYGGGLKVNFSGATINDNVIFSNTAAGGGGVYLDNSSVLLNGNVISNNTAEYGGGLNLYSSAYARLDDNVISSNTATYGGGLRLVYDYYSRLSRNTIISNTANWGGGGLYIDWYSNVTLANNLVADNRADTFGSGLYIRGSAPRLIHTTIARNRGGDGSGIYIRYWRPIYKSVAMTNTILVSQTVGIVVTEGNTATLEATLWGSDTWANGTDWSGGGAIFTGTVNIWDDPAFEDPDAGDYHLRPESAALDKGVPTGVVSDIDGEPRPMGLGYDIGADEVGMIVVRKRANPDPVQAGERLTYTLRVTNAGNVDLHATITDVLPLHITPGETPSGTLIVPGGILTWTALITAPGGVWAETLVVTAEMGYAGPLTNVVRIATAEGETGVYTVTSGVVLALTNQAPDAPSNPDPADGAVGVPLTGTLHWQGDDPDDDPLTYTVAFGVSDPPPPVSQVQTTSYAPGGLVAGTTYYWAITASDGISSTAGPTWRFSTQHFVYLPVVLKTGP